MTIWYNTFEVNARQHYETRGTKMYHISEDQRSKKSAEYIYEALTLLLAERKFSEITISALVKKAGVGRSTFYRCFDTIMDVLQYKSDTLFEACGIFIHHMITVEKKYNPDRTFIIPFLDYWHHHSGFVEVLITVDHLGVLNKSFKRMLEQLRSLYPDLPIEHYDYFVEVRAAIANALLVQWVRDQKKLSPIELSRILKDKILLDQLLYDAAMGMKEESMGLI